MNITTSLEDTAPDNSVQLTQLISGTPTPPRKRCIDRVALLLDDILEARRRKITWDAIAEAMMMNRGTLINAVKKLTDKPTSSGNAWTRPVLPKATSSSSVNNNGTTQIPPLSITLIPDTTPSGIGMTALGRTKIESFNL